MGRGSVEIVLEGAEGTRGMADQVANRPLPQGGIVQPLDRASADNLRDLEAETIARVLLDERWRIDAAARRLGLPRSTLYFKIRALGLRPPRG